MLTINNSRPTRLQPGTYQFTEPVVVALYQGSGDGKRAIDYFTADRIDVPRTFNQFWYGAELLSSEFVDGFQSRDVLK